MYMVWEAASVPIPVHEQQAVFCNTRERVSAIGEAYKRGQADGAIVMSLMTGECTLLMLTGVTVEYGRTYVYRGIGYQERGLAPRAGMEATTWYLHPVDTA